MSEDEFRALVLERFDRLDERLGRLEQKVDAQREIVMHQSKLREEGDGRLGRSLDRMYVELGAISRAQGVQATKVQALCEHAGIRESLHDASEPPQAGTIGGE